MRNFSPVSETKKGSKTLATSSDAKFEKQSKHGKHKVITLAHIIDLATLSVVSLQSNGMLMMMKI